jgi:hypothetical protein
VVRVPLLVRHNCGKWELELEKDTELKISKRI